jgi:hypothetical protein
MIPPAITCGMKSASSPAAATLPAWKGEEGCMERCCDCVYYLVCGDKSYNCGFLIKLVKKNDRCCKYFEAAGNTKKSACS